VMASITALIILLGFEGPAKDPDAGEIDYRRLGDYKLGQALALLGLMVAYALLLRPIGFLPSTAAFLIAGAMILGERKLLVLIPVATLAAGFVWYLVQQVLGIFLSPWPAFIMNGG